MPVSLRQEEMPRQEFCRAYLRLSVCVCVCLCLYLYVWQSNRAWNDAAASQDGSRVVALIEGYDYLYTSADEAASWTPRAGTLFRCIVWVPWFGV